MNLTIYNKNKIYYLKNDDDDGPYTVHDISGGGNNST